MLLTLELFIGLAYYLIGYTIFNRMCVGLFFLFMH